MTTNGVAERTDYGPLMKKALVEIDRLQARLDAAEAALRTPAGTVACADATHPLLGGRLAAAVPIYQARFDRAAHAWLDDHRVYDLPAVPGAAWLEMALAAAAAGSPAGAIGLKEIEFAKILLRDAETPRTVQLVLTPEAAGESAFRIFSRPDGANPAADWTLHAQGRIGAGRSLLRAAPLADLRFRLRQSLAAGPFYERLRERGLHYGPAFQGVEQVWRRDFEALGKLRLPEGIAGSAEPFQVHPVLLDAALQVAAAALPTGAGALPEGGAFIPAGLSGLSLHRRPKSPCWSHAVLRQSGPSTLEADIRLLEEAGQVALEVAGLRLELVGGLATSAPAPLAPATDVRPAGAAAPDRAAILAAPAGERHTLLQSYLRKQLADTLGMAEARLDVATPLPHLGLDSLMTVRLGMRLERELRVKVAMVDFVEGLSVASLATKLLEKIAAEADAGPR